MELFLAGVAVGALLAFIVLAIAQSASKEGATSQAFKAEDAARAETTKVVNAIDTKREQAHATIDQLTPEEIDLVLNGSATLDDVMRKRAAATAGHGEPVVDKPV